MGAGHAQYRAGNSGECADSVGAEALRHMGRSAAPRWVTRKVASGYKMVEQQTAGTLVDGIPAYKAAASAAAAWADQVGFGCFRRMAAEAQTSDGGAEFWRTTAQTFGENELQGFSNTCIGRSCRCWSKLHKRDRRTREKEIADFPKEGFQMSSGG